MSDPQEHARLLRFTAQIVSAHLARSRLEPDRVPSLVSDVFASLKAAETPVVEEPVVIQEPAVAIRKSITPDFLICLEDGRKLKTLKRHLRDAYGLSPEQYRQKWGLSPDYPMVAPNYAARRSELAKSLGLGHRRAQPGTKPARGRRRKA